MLRRGFGSIHDFVNGSAQRVKQSPVHFLDARARVFCHIHMNISREADRSAVAACEGNRGEAAISGRHQAQFDITGSPRSSKYRARRPRAGPML